MNRMIRCILIGLGLLMAQSATAQLQFGPGPDAGAAGDRLDSIVAVVEDDVITLSELERELTAVRQRIRARGANAPPQDVLRRQVLENMIDERLQVRAAERRGISVDDPSLEAAVDRIARQNQLTVEQLRTAVQQEGMDFAEFRDDVRRQVLAQRLRQQVIDRQITVSEQEIDNALSRADSAGGSREYRLAQILIAVAPNASSQVLSQAQQRVEQVIQQLRQGADFQQLAVAVSDGREALQGGELGWLAAASLPRSFAEIVPQMSPGQISPPLRSAQGYHLLLLLDARGEQLRPVTQQRVRHIMLSTANGLTDAEAQTRLRRLRERINAGASFADLARANSTDIDSANRGGALGWLNPGEPSPRFAEAVASLRLNQLSEPFQTDQGWHIAEVLERRQQHLADEAQREQLREALMRRKAEEEWALWLRQLRDRSYVEIRG